MTRVLSARLRCSLTAFAALAAATFFATLATAAPATDAKKLKTQAKPELSAAGGSAMEQEWKSQFEALRNDLANRGYFARVAKETLRPEALVRDDDRDPANVVLRRTAALLADLKRNAATGLAELEQQLAGLQKANATIAPSRGEARYALFADACRVRRQIAFRNPLLRFDQLLFIKRHRALYDHMCDQYYGMAARPGGGLYVLSDPFGPNPQLRDVLADAVLRQGRLQGQKLAGGPSTPPPLSFDGMGNLYGPDTQGGSFLSPDLSNDGKTVVFSYVECSGDKRHRHHTDPTRGHWAEGRCYHIFKVNLDGSELVQLTDGTWNDFDPCWLPNGRIAFMSERRGGYLRCGRVCPIYTLYDMAGDGSDITCLSFHETNEWDPSVTHDGRIIYTRWDYVDRYGCTAHLPWITTLDGRDSRAVHGNFAPAPTSARHGDRLPRDARLAEVRGHGRPAPRPGLSVHWCSSTRAWPTTTAWLPCGGSRPRSASPRARAGARPMALLWPLSEDYYPLCLRRPDEARRGYARQPLPAGQLWHLPGR